MKYLSLALLVLTSSFIPSTRHADAPLEGAWKISDGTVEQLLLIAGNYCMITEFDKPGKKFINSMGGPLVIKNNEVSFKVHFNSDDKAEVGKEHTGTFSISNNKLSTSVGGTNKTWTRQDDGKNALAGNWRITKRKVNNEMADIPLRPRRTLKLLTGKYFQWAAINIETGEFSGTGGGTYTFQNGKYIENIEFFSRDNSRVGATLSFDGKVENNDWIHSGLSSQGAPIYEIWSKFKE